LFALKSRLSKWIQNNFYREDSWPVVSYTALSALSSQNYQSYKHTSIGVMLDHVNTLGNTFHCWAGESGACLNILNHLVILKILENHCYCNVGEMQAVCVKKSAVQLCHLSGCDAVVVYFEVQILIP
jgi:hypothetical protein